MNIVRAFKHWLCWWHAVLVFISIFLLSLGLLAGIHRSEKAKRDFQKLHPCPATGKTTGSCKGYIIDHCVPLACGGRDSPDNMQWQTVKAAREKDRWERKDCGAYKGDTCKALISPPEESK